MLGLSANERANRLDFLAKKFLEPYSDRLLPVVLSTNGLHYRSRILLHVAVDKVTKRFQMGHLKIGPDFLNQVIDLTSCPIHNAESNVILRTINQNLSTHFDQSLRLHIRYIYLYDKHLCLVLKMKRNEWKQSRGESISLIKQITDQIPTIKSVSVNIHESSGNRVFDSKGFECIRGEALVHKQFFGMDFKIEPYGFFQNDYRLWDMAIAVVKHFFVKEITDPKLRSVIDLYSGFGSTMALWNKLEMPAIGVELSGSAIRAADRALGQALVLKGQCRNRIPQLDVFQENADEVFVYMNPSRLGAESEITDWMLNHPKISRIAYMSCSLKTLRRDLDRLFEKYQCEQLQPYEFFPQTEHVETLALLTKR